MKIFWLILAALLPAVAWAAPPEAKQGTASVTVRMAPDGVNATVILDHAVTSFTFQDADVVRSGELDVLTPGLSLTGDTVSAAQPFRRFDLRIRPMTQERDAKYPAHFRIGSGGVLYAPALRADPKQWRTRLSFRTRPGEIRVPSGNAPDGFVFIGPANLRRDDAQITLVADPAAPVWLVERSRTALAAAVSTYTAALGAPLPIKPLLIVRHEDGDRNFNVGDVTPGPVTALRFHGPAWRQPDEQAGRGIQSFVQHEAFHFWNGGLASHALETPTWLHEGGAEYGALLAGVRSGLLSEDDAARRLGEALSKCRTAVQASGDKGLNSYKFLPAQFRYPCGMAIQWAADLHVRRESGGKRSVLDAWAETIRVARGRQDRSYALADFYAAAGIEPGRTLAPIALLTVESGPGRWEKLAGAFGALGAEVAEVPSPPGRRAALLFHLLKENCRDLPKGTGYGFYIDGTTLKLDAPKGCGVLAGDPLLQTIEGGDPFEMSAETYAAVQRKCAAKAPVAILLSDGRRIEAPCATPLPGAPRDYQVKRWKPQPLG
ncbi:MAG TPA: hypothetical protein VF655_08375 [Allosphingosinicella sp.]|jgi:hypothetical protein